MARTEQEFAIMDATLHEAKRLAARVVAGTQVGDGHGWKEAGYRTPLEAARVLVGDWGDKAVERAAAEIVAQDLYGYQSRDQDGYLID